MLLFSALVNDQEIASTKHSRSTVYSGRRRARVITSGQVPSLYDSCLAVVRDNIEDLEFVPSHVLQLLLPVLEKCTASQLERIEQYNPDLVLESDEMWKNHVQREFKDAEPEEFESWRELYFVSTC